MNNETTPTANMNIHEDEIDIKRLFFLLLRKWYWLLICLVLGIAGAYFYGKYQHPKYVNDTSLVATESNKGFDIESMFMPAMQQSMGSAVLNEIAILQSYTLNHKAIESLNWRTAWYFKDLFIWNDLYLNEPFIVRELDEGKNAEGIMIEIRPVSDKQFKISAAGVTKAGNVVTEINFSETGTYGKPFKNKYFHFTLYPKNDAVNLLGKQYRFQFLNINKTTYSYLKRINIDLTEKFGEVVKLSLEGIEPMRDIHYLNQLISVYLDLKLDQQTKTQKRSLEFIDEQLSGISESLSDAESTFTEFRSENQIIDITSQGSMVMEQLSEIEREKSQYQMQLDYFLNLQSYLGKDENVDKIVTPSVVGIQDPTLNALVMKLTELYSRRQVLSFSARENNPTLILINQEISQVNGQLRENLVNLIDNAKLTIKSLDKRYRRINNELNNLPQQEQELINIRRKYELTSEIYTFMLQRRTELEIALAGTVVDIQIVDPAMLERTVPTGTSKLLILLMGAFLGLFFPVLLILISDFFNSTIHFQEDVEKLTPLSIVGNVLHNTTKSELVVVKNPSAPITESYRTIRTNLSYKFTSANEKVIGLHSVSPAEGKTFNAVNLASIIAMNDKKTVLVGGDLRKPRLHKIFDIPNKTGLSNYLAGQASSSDIMLKTKIDNLWIIPSGPTPPNPAELLERDYFVKLIQELKEKFDYIVIDNAPVSLVTDGLITSRQSDLNLFVLRYGVSKKDQLSFINDIAQKGVMNNPAIIINDIKLDRFNYGYSYSYKYYHSKGYGEV